MPATEDHAPTDRGPARQAPLPPATGPAPRPTAGAAPRPADALPRQNASASRPPASVPGQADTFPRQKDSTRPPQQSRGFVTDPLDHPDPHTAAQAAAVENLLRCWVREHNLPAPEDATLRIPLHTTGTTLLAPIHYWSPTGWHRFGLPHFADAPEGAPPADAVTVAALLAREATARPASGDSFDEDPATPSPTPVPTPAPETPTLASETADLISRVADSVRHTTAFLAERRSRPADPPDLFLAAEQALVLGHPLHPTPKSREGLSEAEARLYSPESRGSFPLRWLAVAPSVLSTDSAWTERGRIVPADRLTARLAGSGLPLPDGYAALPLHPWQHREIRHRPETAALLDAGLLRDLGPHGSPWHPTSSVRTVHRTGAPAMLKLSLGLRITNSRRENLRKELHRGVEVHRLLRSGLAKEWQTAHPGFDIVRDPAWLAVTTPDGDPVPGLDVMIRHNPFGPTDDVSCVAGFLSPRPYDRSEQRDSRTTDEPRGARVIDQQPGGPAPEQSPPAWSRLADVVTRLAGRTGRPLGVVAAEWFLRYLERVVRPVLWLDSEAGIALEAHQQNTLLLLDADGWPTGGRYRDNQGYYFRESRRADLQARLPGIGEHSDTFVSDEVTDERFTYYLGINNVLGLVGAFGSQRLADEHLLLAALRRFLADVATGPHRLNTSLPSRFLDSPTFRCKANLLTRLHGLDELIGPVDTQSVYVTITNPLHL
ncbi:IucA/IucC family protein [Streptomyces graminofaciens]|nr:IucA/IucC family protein [Streptomyces graminofaciens]